MIGLRHDVDGNGTAWQNSIAMARWEAARGYRSTYYFLHHTSYWGPAMIPGLREIRDLGHEIGLHNNALAEGRRRKQDPFKILENARQELERWADHPVISTAAHGDPDCSYNGFSNYQLFQESYSPHVVNNFMSADQLGIKPRPLADCGFKFQGDHLPRPYYMTDSGGKWVNFAHLDYVVTLEQAYERYPFDKQLIVLQHPDWWSWKLYE